jgi:hypothetical protein
MRAVFPADPLSAGRARGDRPREAYIDPPMKAGKNTLQITRFFQ